MKTTIMRKLGLTEEESDLFRNDAVDDYRIRRATEIATRVAREHGIALHPDTDLGDELLARGVLTEEEVEYLRG